VNAIGETPGAKRKSLRTLYLPNSSPVPNWVFDTVVPNPDIPSATIRVLLFLLRQTVGWSNQTKELSLTTIQNGAGVTRHTAIHSIRVLTDCWGCFEKERGWKLQGSSVYKVSALKEEDFDERAYLCCKIYGTEHPSPAQLKQKPCTPELLAAQAAIEDEIDRKKDAVWRARQDA
jgi:hypothetical protein